MANRERDSSALTAFALARRQYIRFARAVRTRGLDAAVIAKRAATISDGTYLNPVAYAPTGVALGCPLPRDYTAALWRLTHSIGASALILVPPEAYHITVVNRAHYEETAPSSLTPDEYTAVRATIARLRIARVAVVATGFIVTPGGHLLVQGLPHGDELLTLRRALIAAIPTLGVHVPLTAQIKVAHLRHAVDGYALTALLAKLHGMSAYTARTLTFTDVFTPRGRIPLEHAP